MLARSVRLCLILAALAAAGCENERTAELRPADLDAAERRLVGRVLVLERAKAVALVDRAAGDALLDSLAAAWGDSALPATIAEWPGEPERAARVGRLLSRLLDAEQDSLLRAPRPDRLTAPWPDLTPPAAEDVDPGS